MNSRSSAIFLLFRRLVLLLALYFLLRILFLLFNHGLFHASGLTEYLLYFAGGMRFDGSVIVLANSLFILLSLLPVPIREHPKYASMLKWLFIAVNSLAVIVSCIDMAYYPFVLKRSTAELFNFFSGRMGNDASRLIPLFLRDYWYIVLTGVLLVIFLIRSYNRTGSLESLQWHSRQYVRQSAVFIAGIVIATIIYRGGLQLKPISTVDAADYAEAGNVALVLNTPFTILKTLDLQAIEPKEWYTDKNELQKVFNPVHNGTGPLRKLNVFVIVLESFSKEYIGSLNGKGEGYTPFLDSLIGQGLVMTNAFSNGKRSIEGIPSIVAGLPPLMNEPFITSPYAGNQITSLAGLLGEQGYYTAFFHGGTNGTMGFDAFSHLAGYDHYFGRKEYNNEKDYDGNWGIWDEEFLQYTANTILQQKEPFCVTLFTLTSHHPYPVPEKYKGKFREGPLSIEHSIGYTDYALRKFFETASKMPWFNNTLFVFSADHTGISADPYFSNRLGNNSIPILYYMPSDPKLKGRNPELTQQIDILPSVLDYLHYPKSYFAFGHSIFDSTSSPFVIGMNNSDYQLQNDSSLAEFDGNAVIRLYNTASDSLLNNNLAEKNTAVKAAMDRKIKAIIQTYQQRMIENKMRVQ